jgi:hypothetical protein
MAGRADRPPSRERKRPLDGRRPPDSRWWYWIVGVSATALVWLVTFLWVALATAAEFGADAGLGGDPVSVAFGLSLLIAGVPLAVVGLLFPAAALFDSRAVRRAGFEWPAPGRWGAGAAASLLLPPVAVALACYYVWRRHRRVGVP